MAAIDECVFLGFTFRGQEAALVGCGLRGLQAPRAGTHRAQLGGLDGHRLAKLAQYLRGWMGYFGISQYYRPIPELDEWLRRRVRMCYWKQWRLRAYQGAQPAGPGNGQAA